MKMYEMFTQDKKPNCLFCIHYINFQTWENNYLISVWKECELKLNVGNSECYRYKEN